MRNSDAGRRSRQPSGFWSCYRVVLRRSWRQALAAWLCTVALLLAMPGVTDVPETVVPVHTEVALTMEAEGHPVLLTIDAVDPQGNLRHVVECPDATTCSGVLVVDQCGVWQLPATAQYAHEDPDGGGPYVWGGGTAAVVVGCEVFADGFETGDTSAWSQTQGGSV